MAQPSWKIKKFAPKVTKAERHFFFKGLKEAGIPFITQEPIQGASGRWYRVDGLVAPNVIVEIDGDMHDDWKQQLKDEARDQDLRAAGFVVIRFKNWEVYKQLAQCVSAVVQLLPKQVIPDDRNACVRSKGANYT